MLLPLPRTALSRFIPMCLGAEGHQEAVPAPVQACRRTSCLIPQHPYTTPCAWDTAAGGAQPLVTGSYPGQKFLMGTLWIEQFSAQLLQFIQGDKPVLEEEEIGHGKDVSSF